MSVKVKSPQLIFKGLLVLVLVLVGYWGYAVFFPHSLPSKPYQLVIDRQESLRSVAFKISEAGLIERPHLFILLARLMHKDKKITAGLYILKEPLSLFALVLRISNGKPDEISITLLDGWTFKQIRNYVNQLANVNHLTLNMNDLQIRNSLKINYPNMEGVLYASTYFIAPQQSDLEIFQNAYKLMQLKLAQIWLTRNANTNYSNPYALLTMASLIQKETNDAADMYQVATVFNNRIRNGMRLQDDPAVFYGLGNKERITREDFQIDTAYNTYLRQGLPPTPICTPSLHALNAAAGPSNDYSLLYFIAIGGGKSKFSATFQEHIQAVNKYLKKPPGR